MLYAIFTFPCGLNRILLLRIVLISLKQLLRCVKRFYFLCCEEIKHEFLVFISENTIFSGLRDF